MGVTPGARGIRNRKTCDQAERAARVKRDDEAEALYLAALEKRDDTDAHSLAGEIWAVRVLAWLSRLLSVKEADERGADAPIRLSYGNFLASRGRRREAAAQWREAARGALPEEQALTAALRAADVYLEEDGDRAAAAGILDAAVARFPKAPEARMLRIKRESLSSPADGDLLGSGWAVEN